MVIENFIWFLLSSITGSLINHYFFEKFKDLRIKRFTYNQDLDIFVMKNCDTRIAGLYFLDSIVFTKNMLKYNMREDLGEFKLTRYGGESDKAYEKRVKAGIPPQSYGTFTYHHEDLSQLRRLIFENGDSHFDLRVTLSEGVGIIKVLNGHKVKQELLKMLRYKGYILPRE